MVSLNDPTDICPTIPSIRTLHFMGHAPPIQCMIGSLAAHQRETWNLQFLAPSFLNYSSLQKLTLLHFQHQIHVSFTTTYCIKVLTYLKNITLYDHLIFKYIFAFNFFIFYLFFLVLFIVVCFGI